MTKKPKEELSDEEAELRTTEALRRALATPYRPQKELVGKGHRQVPAKRRTKAVSKKK